MVAIINKIFFLLLFLQVFTACTGHDNHLLDFSNSSKHSFSLVKICVDISLITNDRMNTKNYIVDLSGSDSLHLNKKGVDSFISLKNSVLPTDHNDSTIIGVGEEARMLQTMLIRFMKITRKENGLIVVEMRKFKSSKEKTDIEIILSPEKNGYFFLSAKETR